MAKVSQWEENYSSAEYRGNGYIKGCPVRLAETENEALRELYNTPVDIARFTTYLDYDFYYNTLQQMFQVTGIDSPPEEVTLPDGFEDKYVWTASDMDIDAAAQSLVDELRWRVAEG